MRPAGTFCRRATSPLRCWTPCSAAPADWMGKIFHMSTLRRDWPLLRAIDPPWTSQNFTGQGRAREGEKMRRTGAGARSAAGIAHAPRTLGDRRLQEECPCSPMPARLHRAWNACALPGYVPGVSSRCLKRPFLHRNAGSIVTVASCPTIRANARARSIRRLDAHVGAGGTRQSAKPVRPHKPAQAEVCGPPLANPPRVVDRWPRMGVRGNWCAIHFHELVTNGNHRVPS